VTTALKSGSLSLLEPSGPVQACNGIALLLALQHLFIEIREIQGREIVLKGPAKYLLIFISTLFFFKITFKKMNVKKVFNFVTLVEKGD
jgi:hypothetical protein